MTITITKEANKVFARRDYYADAVGFDVGGRKILTYSRAGGWHFENKKHFYGKILKEE